MSATRQYDIVVLGPGYTGKLTAEHIATSLPTDIKWALAGRSASKLEALAAECKALNPDRIQPVIEVCSLNDAELEALALKTKVLISTIGPFALHGEVTVKACARTGTHYVDVTGEIPWVGRMIKKYSVTAKESGSIMIPQCGFDSTPADISAYILASKVRERYDAPLGQTTLMLHNFKAAASGGTLASALGSLDVFSLRELLAINRPFSISPIPGPKVTSSKSWLTALSGVHTDPALGVMVKLIADGINRPIVERTWGLLGGGKGKGYGPKFTFAEYLKSKNIFTAAITHFVFSIGMACLTIPFLRRLIKKRVYQPGDGPTKEQYQDNRFSYRGVGTPDTAVEGAERACVDITWNGSLYAFTGVSASQAALTILRGDHDLSEGGLYTPACLGWSFIERLKGGGLQIETRFLS